MLIKLDKFLPTCSHTRAQSIVAKFETLCGILLFVIWLLIFNIKYHGNEIHYYVLSEMSHFKQDMDGAWKEMMNLQNSLNQESFFRSKRSETWRCKCAKQPTHCPEGQEGPPGEQGADGEDGEQGLDGKPGIPGFLFDSYDDSCLQCPAGPPGPPGESGATGPTGAPGIPGASGKDGKVGMPGLPGSMGDRGAPGAVGKAGAPGIRGKDQIVPFYAPGKPGLPGPSGKAGPPGEPGIPAGRGKIGLRGPLGPPGKQGISGSAGQPGQLGHIGAAGNNAGYCSCPPRSPPLVLPPTAVLEQKSPEDKSGYDRIPSLKIFMRQAKLYKGEQDSMNKARQRIIERQLKRLTEWITRSKVN